MADRCPLCEAGSLLVHAHAACVVCGGLRADPERPTCHACDRDRPRCDTCRWWRGGDQRVWKGMRECVRIATSDDGPIDGVAALIDEGGWDSWGPPPTLRTAGSFACDEWQAISSTGVDSPATGV